MQPHCIATRNPIIFLYVVIWLLHQETGMEMDLRQNSYIQMWFEYSGVCVVVTIHTLNIKCDILTGGHNWAEKLPRIPITEFRIYNFFTQILNRPKCPKSRTPEARGPNPNFFGSVRARARAPVAITDPQKISVFKPFRTILIDHFYAEKRRLIHNPLIAEKRNSKIFAQELNVAIIINQNIIHFSIPH